MCAPSKPDIPDPPPAPPPPPPPPPPPVAPPPPANPLPPPVKPPPINPGNLLVEGQDRGGKIKETEARKAEREKKRRRGTAQLATPDAPPATALPINIRSQPPAAGGGQKKSNLNIRK